MAISACATRPSCRTGRGQASRWSFSRLRNRLDANISQQLGNGGSLYLNGSSQLERRRAGGQLLGRLQQPVARRQFSISAQRLRTTTGFSSGDRRGGTSTLFSPEPVHSAGRRGTRVADPEQLPDPDISGGTQLTSGVSGMLGKGRGLLLAVGLPAATAGRPRSASLDYRLPQVNSAPTSRQGPGYRRLSVRPRGGLVAHSGGITAAQTPGGRSAWIHAPNARGAAAQPREAGSTARLYAVIPTCALLVEQRTTSTPTAWPTRIELDRSPTWRPPPERWCASTIWCQGPCWIAGRRAPPPFAGSARCPQQAAGERRRQTRLVLRFKLDRDSGSRCAGATSHTQQCLVDYTRWAARDGASDPTPGMSSRRPPKPRKHTTRSAWDDVARPGVLLALAGDDTPPRCP